VLGPEAAAALIDLRKRTGRTYSAIIEGLLLTEHAKDVRRVGEWLASESAAGTDVSISATSKAAVIGRPKGNRKEAERPPC
jgi:hypothetical protein